VAVDNIGACGSQVLGVNELNIDAYVVNEADVILVNWSNATCRAPSPGSSRAQPRQLATGTGRQSMMDVMDSTRLDRWLWAVRLTKTRPDAAAACRGGHVRVNDRPAKPSTTVSPGDEVRARVGDTTRIVEVVRLIEKRVGAVDAVTCYLDRTPAPPPTSPVPVAARDRGAGRPTKRDRRILDRWRAGQR
jgi:ribosome-associated heat shock protein Hsp15